MIVRPDIPVVATLDLYVNLPRLDEHLRCSGKG